MAQGEFNRHAWSEQELQNKGFDPTFEVPAFEMLGYDSTNNVLRRIVVNSSGQIVAA